VYILHVQICVTLIIYRCFLQYKDEMKKATVKAAFV
jgi:hypothetical protein